MNILLLGMLGWGVGAFVNGIVGFGAALVAMPILAFGIDMTLAVPCAGLIVLALNFQMVWNYRRHLSFGGLGPLLAGALPGAFIGAFMLRSLSESGLRLGLGVLLVGYGAWGLLARRAERRELGRPWAVLTGLLSTSFGTAYGINGPPLAVYLSFRGGGQQETKAALGAFFIVSGFFVVGAQAAAGVLSLKAFQLFAASLPALLLGGWAGMRLSRGINDKSFQSGLYLMLLLMGANMLRLAIL
jgi:uncharacterized membrane protein YfcA